MPTPPFIHIDLDAQGSPRLQSNLTHPGLILGLLEHAKFLMLKQLTQPPVTIQTVNGGVATDRILKS